MESHWIPITGDYVYVTDTIGQVPDVVVAKGILADTSLKPGCKIRLENNKIWTKKNRETVHPCTLESGLLVGNIFDPTWKSLVAVDSSVSIAKSGRTLCEICRLRISRGEHRLKHVRSWYVSTTKRINNRTWWYHLSCRELPPVLLDSIPYCVGNVNKLQHVPFDCDSDKGLSQITSSTFRMKSSSQNENTIRGISLACRNVISREVNSFKENYLASGKDSCPISGEKLDLKNAHVHHQYPHSFHDIVLGFIENYNFVNNASISGGEFLDYDVRYLFADFHRKMARLLVVHPISNLSVLKMDFNQGKCDYCTKINQLVYFKEFDTVLCSECRYKHFICTTEAEFLFRLNKMELLALDYVSKPNRISKNFPDTRLFRVIEVFKEASIIHGSSDCAYQYAMRKIERKKRSISESDVVLLQRNLRSRYSKSTGTDYFERKKLFRSMKIARFELVLKGLESLR